MNIYASYYGQTEDRIDYKQACNTAGILQKHQLLMSIAQMLLYTMKLIVPSLSEKSAGQKKSVLLYLFLTILIIGIIGIVLPNWML